MAIRRFDRSAPAENLLPYSEKEPSIFKTSQLTPIQDLKLLVKDYPQISKNALTILVNISDDKDVLKSLSEDDPFLDSLLLRITNSKEPNANEIAMLLSNMAKSERLKRLFTLKKDPVSSLSTSKSALDQLLDCFVKGASGSYNPAADFDYLAYLFADLAKYPEGHAYLASTQDYDGVFPLAKLLPFTSHASHIRRLGVASVLKNVSFDVGKHSTLLEPPLAVLPYLLLPLASGEDSYSDKEQEEMMEELQLLDPGVKREKDGSVLKTHLETLLLLATTREGRDLLRGVGTYFVIRECHLAVEEEGVREACDRLVQVLMRDEEGEEKGEIVPLEGHGGGGAGEMVTQREDSEDEDDKVVDIEL
ncbi:MAG: hypothetical protein MMC23_000193 [Stictis urceolatum]|nr:hypothetical protein [Stictis urceolata]